MSFSDIVGHERQLDMLKRLIMSGRIPHALLFTGRRGIGKRMTADIFAMALNCNSDHGDCCGICDSCASIRAGSSPNLIVVEPKLPESKGAVVDFETGMIRIQDIRTVQNRLSLMVEPGRKKICIMDGAERMTREAANAFLKILEEPAGETILILVSSAVTDIIPTVLSRCHRINFSPLARHLVRGEIMRRLSVSRERADLISSLGGGSLGIALARWREESMEDRRAFLERLANICVEDKNSLLDFAEDVAKTPEIGARLEMMQLWYRDIAVTHIGMIDMVVNIDMRGLLERCAEALTFKEIWECFSAIRETERDVMPPRYANRQLSVETLFIYLHQAFSRS